MQLEHSCDILLASELFTFHSERMCDLLVQDVREVSMLVVVRDSVSAGLTRAWPFTDD